MNKLEIAIEREYKVVKANEIIQKARVDLGLLEQKSFCYAVSKIKPDDVPGTEYTFTINDYADVCGINRNDGRTLENVKKALKQLRDTSFYLVEEDGSETLIGWLSKVRILPHSGKVKIKFDEDMQKYLMGLYNNYTQYSLLCVLPMRSAYSIRLYEMCKSYIGLKRRTIQFPLEDLQNLLCSHYERYPDFRRKVLEVATREINLYTDIEVRWEPVTKGRKVIAIKYFIKARDTWDMAMNMCKASNQLEHQIDMQEWLS